jgi:hypothetical protein
LSATAPRLSFSWSRCFTPMMTDRDRPPMQQPLHPTRDRRLMGLRNQGASRHRCSGAARVHGMEVQLARRVPSAM